jgi:hypothetical protein
LAAQFVERKLVAAVVLVIRGSLPLYFAGEVELGRVRQLNNTGEKLTLAKRDRQSGPKRRSLRAAMPPRSVT